MIVTKNQVIALALGLGVVGGAWGQWLIPPNLLFTVPLGLVTFPALLAILFYYGPLAIRDIQVVRNSGDWPWWAPLPDNE